MRAERPGETEAWSPVAFPHKRPTPTSVGREGMVTVWASDGLYLGCMGVETWKRLLDEETNHG